MTYQFDSEVAEKYGVESAVLIQNIAFWIRKNMANNKHYYDGRYWTYNSVKAFSKLFPFWSYGQSRRIIEGLLKQGVLIVGNYNENTYDRTSWYAFSDELIVLLKLESDNDKCIRQNQQLHLSKSANGIAESAICYKETDNKPYNKQQIVNEGNALAFFEENSPSEWESFQMRFRKNFEAAEWEKFKELFDCKFNEEGKEYSVKTIGARLTRFAINYCDNLKKVQNTTQVNGNSPQIKQKIQMMQP